MDIHRSRFVPFPPSAINALAFSHTEPTLGNKDPEGLRLAVGRANGNIEIWNPANGAWQQEQVFYGGKDRSVEGLAWTQEPDIKDSKGRTTPGRLRLFSIGYSNSVTEWDVATGLPARHSDGNNSEVWCFAAQPKFSKYAKGPEAEEDTPQKLVAGCADGTLVLLSTADNDLRFEKFVARSMVKKARVLSVTFKDRRTVIAGFADSTIRVYDTRNGFVIRNISLGNRGPGGPRETLVWKVRTLPNGGFVSGDSNGDICIYDGKNYSQTQRISAHEADVLDLAVSRDGTKIFSGGMDCRTSYYTCNQRGKWREVSHQRYHDHDVKAMAAYDGAGLSVAVSGGIDTQPIVLPIRNFGKELSRGLPALPQSPSLLSAPDARLMVSWWNCEIRVWRVKAQDDNVEKPKVVARLALQGDENISSVSITRDGGLLAVSTVREVKLFQLLETNTEAGSGLRIRKLELPSSLGAKLVRFTPDGKWLAIINVANEVSMLRIVRTEDERPRALHKPLHLYRLDRDDDPLDPLSSPSGLYSRSISQAEFSQDGSVFAVADIAGYVDTWVTEGHEDVTAPEVDVSENDAAPVDDDDSEDEEGPQERITFLGQRWVRNPSAHLFPRFRSAPALLSFEPTSVSNSRPEPRGNPAVHPTRGNPHPHSHEIPDTEHRLLVVSADQELYLFDVLAGRLSEWSRRNPPSSYPAQYRILKSPAKGCIWDAIQRRVWLYGEGWLFMFDLNKDLPIPESIETQDSINGEESDSKASKKRKREGASRGVNGAGDAVPEKDAPVTKMRRFDSAEDDESKTLTEIGLHDAQMGDSDNEMDGEQGALVSLRRSREEVDATNGANDDVAQDTDGALEQQRRTPEPWWHTFQYRPILGIVPIGKEGQPLEVVLVERPSWELDLPPRFVGAHE
ncbi:U3 small nucleolar RNA-associated protein [Didymosphaeria variabile]|uniref:U3 small nucleolar RNA-associated protein n=1 Tax=Didymosphaeria variabile TaxID=1932322 RepID=A0A9W9CF89_9PLEO|nr:U3 small nucleolar RNA-associated protein [Didymosphaeria variabile]KAJ4358553.1 U3 small nucleolar RNA-associated protein [Didymosphaeria variabile]